MEERLSHNEFSFQDQKPIVTVIVAVAAWNVNKPDAHERKIMYLTTIVLVIVSLSCCKNNLRQIDADNIFKKESAAETISIEFQENAVFNYSYVFDNIKLNC